MLSNHRAIVYQIYKEKHPFADLLSVVNIDGFTICVNSASWEDGQLGVFILPESLVDTDLEPFSFLKDKGGKNPVKIGVKKLKGIYSQGCLVPAPEGSKVGDDVTELLNIKHYEPIIEDVGADEESPPPLFSSLFKYDLENFRKYSKCFIDGEIVNVTEKLHGSNMRCVYSNDKMYVGSKSRWIKENDGNEFWKAFRSNPNIEKFCMENPNLVIYGEQIGGVKGFYYDCVNGERKFKAFDIRRQDFTFLDVPEFLELTVRYGIDTVPQLGSIPFDRDTIAAMADGETTLGKAKMREGIVCKPLINRMDRRCEGRVVLKLVSNAYLEKG